MQSISLIFFLLFELVLGKLDSDALLELKKGIEKDPLGRVLSSWDGNSVASNGCPQNWYGISCSEGQVTSITLNDLGLIGNFQFSALSGLKMLQNLTISNNQLTGIILGIGSIGSLEILDVSRNSFHGSVPSDLKNLKNLVLLNLSSNNLVGTIPPSFGELEQLKDLDLHSNSFTGDISDLIMQLQIVVFVDLSGNKFSGSLNFDLGNSTFVSTVQYLNLSHNALVGELFARDGMPYFDQLEVFDASCNQLSGQIPSFNFVVSLRILQLRSNQFSGSLPEALLQESSMLLTELDLSLNQLKGPLGSITSVTLKNLNLSSNKLSGSLPVNVGHCAIVDLSNNMFSGNLSRIQTWGNYVEVIHLSSNALTGTLPNRTSQFLRLNTFKVSNNSLEGSLPPVLGTYPELNVIDLSLNQLNGFLLPGLFKLTDLNLSGNSFTGPIPLQDIASIYPTQNLSLVSLDLSANSLSGILPAKISRLRSLLYLDLSRNNFEGSIPVDLPDVLKGFNVSYNNLSGIVPDNLMRFPDSSFHPGNFLLLFPNSSSSPTNVPEIPLQGKRASHMRPAIKDVLIVCLVSGAAVIALLAFIIYYRFCTQECGGRRRSSPNKNFGRKDVREGGSPVHIHGLHDNVDPAPALKFPPDHLLSSQKGSMHEHGSTSIVGASGLGATEAVMKEQAVSSPISLFSSPSPSKDPHLSENPTVFKVCNPDRLAGDLHLFDSSLLFSAEELSRAPAEIIGRSCHGTSYKATLDSGHVLVVKWLREGIAKGKKEFAREAKKLGCIRHPNIVSLRGYYWGTKDHEKLIISNYVCASCLDIYLYDNEPRKFLPLCLDQRLKIATDVARCLNYLHSERAIPHGNLKSANILLEPPSLNILLTDYSLHRIMTPAGTAEQVLNSGALGYRPPEFASSSKPCPSLKSDVYAFGVILLELLTGKSAGEIISGHQGVVDLTDWVRLLAAENRSAECFDKLIASTSSVHGLARGLDHMLQVALRCILSASERPDMKTVLEELSSIVL
ncbi:probable inactive receptor kinase At5g10020 [Telopea speciosissima]|uniref:probable inactive receptor kinase At5g10020 n=1 Tax=Telopea speciosissima TaxID=54955 RepID=UPI001CC6272C|nr:probable inactive receptor kinase At5g10020 [Telopea speciosissima]